MWPYIDFGVDSHSLAFIFDVFHQSKLIFSRPQKYFFGAKNWPCSTFFRADLLSFFYSYPRIITGIGRTLFPRLCELASFGQGPFSNRVSKLTTSFVDLKSCRSNGHGRRGHTEAGCDDWVRGEVHYPEEARIQNEAEADHCKRPKEDITRKKWRWYIFHIY